MPYGPALDWVTYAHAHAKALVARLPAVLIAAGGGARSARALAGDSVSTDNVKARLISEVGAIAPGQSFWVALEFDIRDGWHTYWRNPGDSGQATKLAWTLPAGVTAGEIVWPAPHRFELPPLVNYGYAKHVMHLVEIAAPRDSRLPATLALRAKASWLVCADVCIPESADLQLDLPVNAQAARSTRPPRACSRRRASELPGDAPAVATARIADGRLVLTLGKEWGRTLERIEIALRALRRRRHRVRRAADLDAQHPRDSTCR